MTFVTVLADRPRHQASRQRAASPPGAPAGCAIAAVAATVPERVVPSSEVAAQLGVEPGWIERRTGIRERRIAGADERLDAYAAAAGHQALRRAGVAPEDVDLVLVATATADELMPNAAPLVAYRLGAERAGAFDIGSACTGFLTALATGCAFVEARRARCVLVVGADLMSRVIDPADRATAAVFADGAGAVVLVATAAPGRIGPVILGSDGSGAGHIRVPRRRPLMEMRGHETFREAVARLSLASMQALSAAGVALDEVDLFVYHQANARILQAVGERLGVPAERVLDCIGEYGNTSAATLPLSLWRAEQDGRLRPGDRILLGAFGAGFTWGATVVEWGFER
jgi:3-oxoacyl-[acyl-carrier-protein] synthase-3